jgi:hypothetical protein
MAKSAPFAGLPPSLRFGAPSSEFTHQHRAGRDVGLAESGFALPAAGSFALYHHQPVRFWLAVAMLEKHSRKSYLTSDRQSGLPGNAGDSPLTL